MRIWKFVLARLLLGLITLFLLLTVIFFTLRVIPGDPVDIMLAEGAPEWVKERLRHEWGLDKPIYIQYIDYLYNIFVSQDLGVSRWSSLPVTDEILTRFPTTLELTIASMCISAIIGIPLGIFSAVRRDKAADHLIRMSSIFMYSLPVFFVGTVFQMIFGVSLYLLPIYGRVGKDVIIRRITGLNILDGILTGNLEGLSSSLIHLILPSMTLSLFLISVLTRMTRANMIEVLGERYITTAKAKGLPQRVIVYKHALRNAIIPIFTVGMYYFANLLGGAVITESIFSLPGIGRLVVDAALRRDYPVVQGCAIFYALIVVITSIIIDIGYSILNPQVRI